MQRNTNRQATTVVDVRRLDATRSFSSRTMLSAYSRWGTATEVHPIRLHLAMDRLPTAAASALPGLISVRITVYLL